MSHNWRGQPPDQASVLRVITFIFFLELLSHAVYTAAWMSSSLKCVYTSDGATAAHREPPPALFTVFRVPRSVCLCLYRTVSSSLPASVGRGVMVVSPTPKAY